ncbi:L-alanine-DL-glutamate epimerase-like enolase superfamily enzyme [Geodermatophilus bullaregiensis]|uniref:mandelate racemase/muconate lactonizing enzyme family protein n=1 Tax=Geodermatophilus bullaregiensis TaxID=1564160 RepID=UPI0019598DCB|nr:mandelate racemase/muconate lactonizing enzyme family protein [Geodermatophilus bullaregiensis]MBM7807922.1 L-alanine-DL-glutamate epimerase-like enolase superfamily enzyme [Geodermatophilus bullaregiensis]
MSALTVGTRPPVVEQLTSRLFRLPLSRPWGEDVPALHLLVTELTTDDGRTGTGFSWTPSIGARAVQALVEHDVAPVVVGGPTDPGVVWDRLWWHLHEAGGGGLTTMAIAAVDIALWDLGARAAGRSLVDHLGRRRESVPAYGSGVNLHYPLDELREQARRWVAQGCRGVKIKVGRPDLAEDVERVAAVREVIGPHRQLMVDANQRWDLPTALRAVRALSRFDLYWVEEPLVADDLPALSRLHDAGFGVPIAVGENVYTTYQYRHLLASGAADVVQPNAVRVGGITPFLRIAQLARAASVPVAPHLLPDLSGQLALCLPDTTMVEDVEDASFAALGALAQPSGVTVAGGVLRAETGPGHGLVFATDRLEEMD